MQNITYAIDNSYAHVTAEALEIADTLAKGCFQRGLIRGRDSISLATLKGKAKKYGAHYRRSADNFITRLSAHPSLIVREVIGDHNRRELVVTTKLES